MREERLEVSVTFDERRGYIGSAPELRLPVMALSLGGLRRKIEALLLPDNVRVVLQLDGLAERERHRRRGFTSRKVSVVRWKITSDRSPRPSTAARARGARSRRSPQGPGG